PKAVRGTRVRLHIDGLGSPMKARVRDGTGGEVLVGSNLEFLRVGRHVEFENVDDQENRPARIERVSVEVEPSTHVPQLVVALRYLDVADEAPATMTTAYAEDESDEPSEVDDGDEPEVEESVRAEGDPGEDGDEAYDDEAYEDEEEDEEGESRAAVVWSKVKQVGPKVAVVGSFARRWGGKAKDVMGDAVVSAKKKAVEKVKERREAKAPLRTTAPPPKGALRGDGTRSRVNEIKAKPEPAKKGKTKAKAKAKKNAIPKRAAMVALITVLLTVVGVGFASNAFMSADAEEATAKAETTGAEAVDNAALNNPEPEAATDDPGDPPIVPGHMGAAAPTAGAGLVANVPLFGATPMSTAAPMAPMAAVPVAAVPAVPAATPPPSDSIDEEGEGDDDSDMGAAAAADGDGDDSFGSGRVSNPVVLTLRMNRKIKKLKGAKRSDGFTVDVVGARSREPAGGFRRQDKRIASAKVVNRGSNAQLTIRFRGGVPDYRVQAQGSTLRILLDGDKKTASSDSSARGKKRR
ncbi:MAG: hypothetical protein ACOC1F_04295, partial [Myxococcota bacterium]